MSRTTINLALDVALALMTLALVWTGLVLRLAFPPPTVAQGWTLWGYGYDSLAELQFFLLAGILLGVLVHVMLHWTWVCGVIASRVLRRKLSTSARDDGSLTIYGVATLIIVFNVLGLLLGLAVLSVQPPEGPASVGVSAGRHGWLAQVRIERPMSGVTAATGGFAIATVRSPVRIEPA